ncbi:hypothetical protein [Bacteroides sp. 51]|uniref:hypothetical protein n=1 Tax=Bacteroides sp. 51 TaxID=2302938 RepID=UPI0013D68E9A|nr:hypothetical protein [Bacteroides sp. 51]NDV83535.1 hypothetical protein [Bacteroides sp. 51]
MQKGIVIDKEFKQDYEAGSGSLTIPVLSDLFPSLFEQKMKAVDRYFALVKIGDEVYRYEIDSRLYNEINKDDAVMIGIDKYGMPQVTLI